MKKTTLILLLFICSFLFSCSKGNYNVSVMLCDGEGYTIDSENPITIHAGEDAKFKISLEKGYEIVQFLPENTFFENGTLIVPNCFYPKTVEISAAKNPKSCKFFFENPQNGGKLESSVKQGRVKEGSFISITAIPKENAVFLGWSTDALLNHGGKLISNKLQTVIKIENDSQIFANFDMTKVVNTTKISSASKTKNDEFKRTIAYDANGGTLKNDKKLLLVDVSTQFYKMPNSLMSDGTFTRDGYILTGYNTQTDGSGTQYGTGHPIKIDDNSDMTYLFCTWKKCSDKENFAYVPYGNGIEITNYIGNETEIVVPEYIDGKTIEKISSYAFSSLDFETIYLPRTLKILDKNAIIDCEKMNSLYIFDGVRDIYDESFSGTTSFKTLNLMASIAPRYTNKVSSFSRKWERFYLNNNKNRIFVVSGSSSHHGFNSPMFEELMDNKYFIVNYGTHGGMNHLIDLEIIEHDIHKNDIVIYAPEQLEPVLGSNRLEDLNFYCYEGCYNVFSYVDISNYTNVFGALRQYNKNRSKMKPLTYQDYYDNFSEYLDRANSVTKFNSKDYLLGANGTFYFRKGVISDENAVNLNAVFDRMKEKGALPVMSYPPSNKNAVAPETLNDTSIDEFNNDMRTRIHIPLISDMRDYIFEGIYMDDTDYHVNDAARDIRTKNLYADLSKYLLSIEETK